MTAPEPASAFAERLLRKCSELIAADDASLVLDVPQATALIAERDSAIAAAAVEPFRELAKSYERAAGQNWAEAKRYEALGRFDLFSSHMTIGGHCSSFAEQLLAILPPTAEPKDPEKE